MKIGILCFPVTQTVWLWSYSVDRWWAISVFWIFWRVLWLVWNEPGSSSFIYFIFLGAGCLHPSLHARCWRRHRKPLWGAPPTSLSSLSNSLRTLLGFAKKLLFIAAESTYMKNSRNCEEILHYAEILQLTLYLWPSNCEPIVFSRFCVANRSGAGEWCSWDFSFFSLQVTWHAVTNGTVYGILLAIALPGCAIKQLINIVQVQRLSSCTNDIISVWLWFTNKSWNLWLHFCQVLCSSFTVAFLTGSLNFPTVCDIWSRFWTRFTELLNFWLTDTDEDRSRCVRKLRHPAV